MGSIGPSNPPPSSSSSSDAEDEIIVVVTGFGPFKSQYPINPSWSIASTLPPFIPLSRTPPLLPSSSTTTTTSPAQHSPHPQPRPATRIRILTQPTPIHVSYSAVRELVPRLWRSPSSSSSAASLASYPRIDFMIHIGMAGGRDFYSIERRGHRDGYLMPDVDGVVLGDERRRDREDREGDGNGDGEGEGGEKGGWIWRGCPEELVSGVDIDDVWERWRAALPDIDVRTSEDAGRYLCDFIYYSSLAELWKRDEDRRVVFLHVPVDSDEVSVARGREVVIELIRALVQSRKMSGLVQQLPERQNLVR